MFRINVMNDVHKKIKKSVCYKNLNYFWGVNFKFDYYDLFYEKNEFTHCACFLSFLGIWANKLFY